MTHLPVGCASAHIVYEEFTLSLGWKHCGRSRICWVLPAVDRAQPRVHRRLTPGARGRRVVRARRRSRTRPHATSREWRRLPRHPAAAVALPASIGRDRRAPCSACGRRRSVSISSEPRCERMLSPNCQLLVRARIPASETASSTVTEKALPASGRRLGYESTLSRHRGNTRHSQWHQMPLRRAASAAAPWRVKRPRLAVHCSLSPNGWMVTLCGALPSRCWRSHACAQRAASVANSRPEPNRTTST